MNKKLTPLNILISNIKEATENRIKAHGDYQDAHNKGYIEKEDVQLKQCDHIYWESYYDLFVHLSINTTIINCAKDHQDEYGAWL